MPTPTSADTRTVGPTHETWDTPLDEPSTWWPARVHERFELEEELGSGGMGVVWKARDRKLDREVALKQVRARTDDGAASRRLRREAEAMAQLDHPHVVKVFDVIAEGRTIVVVMELVRGETLTRWLERRHDRATVIARLREAGRGLAAAHDAGLVHRDFKPGNVMVDERGARVLDFGLARAATIQAARRSEPSWGSEDERTGVETGRETVTRTGALMGTPAYMAPEQHEAGSFDARTDQFAFCTVAWQALVGSRPFRGDFRDLGRAKRAGPPPWPEPTDPMGEVVRRGLQPDPEDRWPSMHELLEAMQPEPARRRVWLRWGVGAALLGGSLFGYVRGVPTSTECPDDALAEVWSPEARTSIRAAIVGDGALPNTQTWERLEPRIDGWTDDWRAAHRDACEALSEDPAADRRMACLQRARRELESLLDALASADESSRFESLQATAALPPVDACSRVDEEPSPSPKLAEEVRALRSELADLAALRRLGRHQEASARLEPLVPRVETVGWGPLSAELEVLRGDLHRSRGEHLAAAERFEAAYWLADEDAYGRVAAEAASKLCLMHGRYLSHHENATTWGRRALSHLERANAPARDRAIALSHLSVATIAAGDLESAEPLLHEALSVLRDSDPDDFAIATVHENLADLHFARRDVDEAIAAHQRALEQRQRTLGERHPSTGTSHNNLGGVMMYAGRLTEAREHLEQAKEIWTETLGPSHPNLPYAVTNLGQLYFREGDLERAESAFAEVLAAHEERFGPESLQAARANNNLGMILHARERLEDAERHFRRALALSRQLRGDEHPEHVMMHDNIGFVLADQERFSEAEAEHARALALAESIHASDAGRLLTPLRGLGTAVLRQGRPQEALSHLRRALALARDEGDDADEREMLEVLIAEATGEPAP